MDHYIDLNRIEFVITDACSGRCKHCSNGDSLGRHENTGRNCRNNHRIYRKRKDVYIGFYA